MNISLKNIKFFIYWGLVLMFLVAKVYAQKVDTLVFNGPMDNRVDIVFFGDGWTDVNQEPPMIADLQSHFEFMFTVPVYERYKKFFNAYRVEHLRAGPPSGRWATNENMEYYLDHIRGAISETEVHYGASREGKGHDNMADGNNTGNQSDNIIVAPTLDPDIIGIHNLGHAWHAVGDIYNGTGGGDFWPNKTDSPNSRKWEHWLGFTEPFNGYEVGVYPIANSSGYREINTSNLMMGDVWAYNRMPIVYTPVEREIVIHDIYGYCDPIDSYTPNSGTLLNPWNLTVKLVDPVVSQIDWYINEELVVEDGGEVLKVMEHASLGQVQISAHVWDRIIQYAYSDRGGSANGTPGSSASDSLDWVRDDLSDLEQIISWDANITSLALGDGLSTQGIVFKSVSSSRIEFELPSPGKYSVELFSIQGQHLKTLASGYSNDIYVRVAGPGESYLNQIHLIRIMHNGLVTWYKWMGMK